MRNAVRLFGGAAFPAYFPPYIGALTDKRVAAILRNSRRTARYCFAENFAKRFFQTEKRQPLTRMT
jgi:hypothetical protein